MQFKIALLVVLSSLCLAAALTADEIKEQWFNFNLKYGKTYRGRSTEDRQRFDNFKNNVEKIDAHNRLFEQNLVSYKMAINPFADMDLKAMETLYMGLKINETEKQQFLQKAQFRLPMRKSLTFPTSKDWREQGAITPVKNQRACGSCWAFASTAVLEAHHFLKHNKSVILSEQNLIDCSTENYGCSGGWIIPSFEYVRINGGINPENVYPYEAVDGECRYQPQHIAATCNGYQVIREDDEQHMLEIVATKGPVAVAIAVNSNFMSYYRGVYNDPSCAELEVNHAVLVVGYGTENGQDYWLVKNSWGAKWGDNGYIKMARNQKNHCSIASYAVYPEL